MCGIAGVVSRNKTVDIASKMIEVLGHRGSDDVGVYSDDEVELANARLSIIDAERRHQPLSNEDKKIWVVFNGEIFNFKELKRSLEDKGHLFKTNCDTEVIAHLYEEGGIDCVNSLNGMFAFAIWDIRGKILFLSRDRFGIKPLYYFNKNGVFAFASELKVLLRLPFITKVLNPEAVDLYFSLEYIPSPLSIFRDISKLRPGHYLSYKDSQMKITRYWDLNPLNMNREITISEAADRLKDFLISSIKNHLLSNVPSGIFLSGGIDSSALIAFARTDLSQDINSFSMGFANKGFDESRYAKQISQYFNTQHHHYIFTIRDLINIFPEVTQILDEPLGDLSIFPTYLLCKFSRRFIKVALSGEAADELFMGYPTYRAHQYMHLYQRIPKQLRKFIITPLINHLPVSFGYFSLDFKLKQFLKGQFLKNPYLRHLLWMGSFSPSDKENLFSEEFKRKRPKRRLLEDYAKLLLNSKEMSAVLRKVQYLDIFSYLSEDLLVKADRASMATSLEIRAPYLDYKLVEFVWSLPPRLIFQKRSLRYLMKDTLPLRTIMRPKRGFALPFSKWILDKGLFALFEELFNKDFILQQNIFNCRYIKGLLNEHISMKNDNRKKLGTYIMFQAWYKNYLS